MLSVGGSGVIDAASRLWVPGAGVAVTPSVTGPFTITSGFTRDASGADGAVDSVDLTFSRPIDLCAVVVNTMTPSIVNKSLDGQVLRLTLAVS